MNVGIGTEAAQFLFWEYLNWIFGTVRIKKTGPQISLMGTFKNFLHHTVPCYLNVWRWRFCAALWKPLAGFARTEQSFKHNLELSAFINSQWYKLFAFINLILPGRLGILYVLNLSAFINSQYLLYDVINLILPACPYTPWNGQLS
jgi:hypothetical protein